MRYETGSALLRHPEFPREKLSRLFAREDLQREAVIIDEGIAVAVSRFAAADSTIDMQIEFLHEDRSNAIRILGYLTEQLMRRYQPKRIRVEKPDSFLIHVLQSNRYYQKGSFYQRITEPWRTMVPDSCFDDEGYIIHQGQMENLPFGWFSTDAKGCGWIAGFNLMKMAEQEVTMEETAHELEERAILGQVMGQSEFFLWVWLRDRGLKAAMSAPFDAHAIKMMKESKYGILLYSHNRGAHYCAYRNRNDGTMQFYNAVYGRKNHIATPEDFLKTYALFPFSSVIYLK
ncbi:MAG: hypothetical protein IKS37_10075 [Solobacterium sp.]|nr:hypothetical protein [Solobacterium sp.]